MGKPKKLNRFYIIKNLKSDKCEYVGTYKANKSIKEMNNEEIKSVLDEKALKTINDLDKENIKYDIECNKIIYSDELLMKVQLDMIIDQIHWGEWRKNMNKEFELNECLVDID